MDFRVNWTDFTISHIHEILSNRFAHNKKNGAENEEKGLAAYSKQFKGSCNNCGKYRHKSANHRDNGESEDT